MNLNELKRADVGYINTPLEPMPNLTKLLGKGPLYVKRDDMTGLAFGGNKARKLDYLVQHALENGYTALMTFGGVQTNHGRMTVAAACKFGLKPILVLTGKKPDYCSGNLILDKMMGADIIFLDTSKFADLPAEEKTAKTNEFIAKATEEIIAKYEKMGEKVLNIPVGGQGMLGSAGYIQAVKEILEQMKAQDIQAKYLITGYGSTGTFGGLWAGAKYYNAPFEVIGIPVNPVYRSEEITAAFIQELSDHYNLGLKVSAGDIRIENGDPSDPYSGAAYNLPDAKTREYMSLLAKTEGIFTDPCYSGKVFRGMVELVKSGIIEPDAGVIFLHSGGTPAIWSREHLDDAQAQFWATDEGITIMKA